MLEGNRVSRISVRGLAVASATAVTAVGAVTGVASGQTGTPHDAEALVGDTTLLTDIPVGSQAEVQTASLTQQADIARAWQRIRRRVRDWNDLEPELIGRVEELIDFVTSTSVE